jgi:hypothetical protein
MEKFIVVMFEAGEKYFLNEDQERWKRNIKNATHFETMDEADEVATDWGSSLPYLVEAMGLSEIGTED